MNIVIFGIADAAQLAHYYFSNDSEHNVVGFTVDSGYIPKSKQFMDLPVVPFEEVTELYPPKRYAMFVALGYSMLNENRKTKYEVAIEKGYELVNYISSKATVLNKGRFGDNCFVLENNTIQPFVSVGNNVTLWSGNHIGHHSVIGDHSFLASHVVVSGRVTIGQSCFLGVNSTLRDNITIGDRSIVGAGALILADLDGGGVYKGTATARAALPSDGYKI